MLWCSADREVHRAAHQSPNRDDFCERSSTLPTNETRSLGRAQANGFNWGPAVINDVHKALQELVLGAVCTTQPCSNRASSQRGLHANLFSGMGHGDPFPLPASLCFHDGVPRCRQQHLGQRVRRVGSRNRRLEKAASSLNGLFSSSGRKVTPSLPLAAATANAAQKAALAWLGDRIGALRRLLARESGDEAILALLKTFDFYAKSPHTSVPSGYNSGRQDDAARPSASAWNRGCSALGSLRDLPRAR